MPAVCIVNKELAYFAYNLKTKIEAEMLYGRSLKMLAQIFLQI